MDTEHLSELEQDIRATADDISADAERVIRLEGEKKELDAEDPRRAEVAREIESLTAKQARSARVETTLVDEAAAAARDGASNRDDAPGETRA